MQQQENEARVLDGEDIEILPSPLLLEEMQWRCSGPFEAGARTTGEWTRLKLLLSISSMRTTSPPSSMPQPELPSSFPVLSPALPPPHARDNAIVAAAAVVEMPPLFCYLVLGRLFIGTSSTFHSPEFFAAFRCSFSTLQWSSAESAFFDSLCAA
ncbi:hypothetical protein CRENBAI_003835 [Crenichthys baileyi]|uniref:Uncharacterized protein n=1 Tax=Crenichthys baileyi TaxID=28760 RepID=A0AAV9RND3_9TELE